MNEFPKYHILRKKKINSAKYIGDFKDGELDGEVKVIVNENIKYRSQFNSGYELPISSEL